MVSGCLYRDVDADALARLDAFEGREYERVRVEVMLDGGGAVAAWVYRFRPEFAARLLPGDWDPTPSHAKAMHASVPATSASTC
ncbi:Gamma-glutamyl AIG2-like cyclotransferase [Roseateles saccharophilus]|uniref:Gamma-glutamyl AIG2-like cyclotransferase n=1 Tax=Roseateles saccharophilus TaxID=304 RepID=A0A4R3V0N5_ROSSA|nr:gamma-glutamyl AIG2-like cyclotransferase [Roseateles saccharophilus]